MDMRESSFHSSLRSNLRLSSGPPKSLSSPLYSVFPAGFSSTPTASFKEPDVFEVIEAVIVQS